MEVRHKKENNRIKHHNKLWCCLVLGILVFSFSCKHYPKEEAKEKEKKLYSVSFSSQNEEFGNVKAKIKGGDEISSPSEVADGSVIIFIAEPKPRCEVVSWQGVELSEPKALQFEVKVNKNIALSAEFFLKDFVKIFDTIHRIPPALQMAGQNSRNGSVIFNNQYFYHGIHRDTVTYPPLKRKLIMAALSRSGSAFGGKTSSRTAAPRYKPIMKRSRKSIFVLCI